MPIITTDHVAHFVGEFIATDSELEARLRAETLALPNGAMISPADVGAFLRMMAELISARSLLEIGTFTGYTALKLALALPSDGRLVCCDVNAEWPAIGQKFWREAGVADRIDLRIGPALETLKTLEVESFDMAFIDANKKSYGAYFEKCLALVRPNGLIILDNMLWDGEVAFEEPKDSIGRYLRALNLEIAHDPRVSACLLSVGDGLMLVRKH